ncbi:MAG: hypothetical protein OEN00_05770 [Gemmatimonadota bacterium]|nr:hypothetical protein [Gemmatimonadota bacterium]
MRLAFQVLSTLTLGAVLVSPSMVAGQAIPSPYTFIESRQEVGLYGGYMSAATGRFGYGPSGGIMFGGRYALQLSGPLALEGVAGAVSGTRDVINPARPEGDRVVGEGDALLATIDARLRLSATGDRAWHGLSPFLALGAGVAFDLSDPAEADLLVEARDVFDFGSSFFGTIALGTRWFATERFALRTDGTFSLWRLKTPPGFSDADRGFPSVEDREWVRGLSVSVSLLYRW